MKQLLVSLVFLLIVSSCLKEEVRVIPNNVLDTPGVPGVIDPLASKAWHLNNTGQTTYSSSGGIAGEDISLRDAMEEGFTGKDIKIAFSDSGTDINHEDLTGNQIAGQHRNYVFMNSSFWRNNDPTPLLDDAHGTATVGLTAAVGWNGLGSQGVAYGAKFGAFRFIIDYSASTSQNSIIARAVDQADGDFDIFNYSYGYEQCYFVEEDPLVLEAIEVGALTLRNALGANYVQSAGNSYSDTLDNCTGYENLTSGYTGNTNFSDDLAVPEKIIVGAVNANGEKSSYSTPGSGIWLTAPGGEYGDTEPAMLTTDISGCTHGYSQTSFMLDTFNEGTSTENKKCNYTSLMNGTSSAAPVVTGVIALMLEAQPLLTWRDVKHILAMTADKVDYSMTGTEVTSNGSYAVGVPLINPLGNILENYVYDYTWIQNNAGIDYSNWYGFGRINALNAILYANTYELGTLGTYVKTSNPQNGDWYYISYGEPAPIPDGDELGTTSDILVLHNLVIESVQVKVNITHSLPSDLGISLISPKGTESRLLNMNNGVYATEIPADKLMLSNAFYGESSLGRWTLKVVDGSGTELGTLDNWQIRVNGHRIDSDDSLPGPVILDSGIPTIYLSNKTTPPITFNHTGMNDVIRYEISVGTSPGSTDVADWTSVGLEDTDVQLTDLDLTNNTTYYYNIRAIDYSEDASLLVSNSWLVSWQ